MKNFRYIGMVLVVALTFGMLISSCSGTADAVIEEAQIAVDDAASMGADEHSPAKFEKAKEFLAQAKTLNEKGEYKEATNKAEIALLNAEKAYEDAERLEASRHEN